MLIPQIIKIANERNMHDVPNERKVHTGKIPTFGGIGIFFGFIITLLILSFTSLNTGIQYLLGAILVIVVVGMRDDFLPLSALWKLIGQIAACSILILGDVRLFSLHGLFGVYEISELLSYAITMYTVIVITNAFNLIDGIDGLAGTVSVIFFGFFGIWFSMNNDQIMTIICFAVCGAVIAFLRFNYSPAQIFMGDTGALLLGFLASAVTLSFFKANAILAESDTLKFHAPISLASVVMVYPLFDTLRVFTIRVLQGRSPFSPDRNHIHHHLLNLQLSHVQATLCIATTTLIFIVVMLFLNHSKFNDNVLVPVIVLTASLIGGSIEYYSVKKERKK